MARDGYEGPPADLERNTGFSDAWFGLKDRVAGGRMPLSVGASPRTPMFYDREGPYNRYTFDSSGRVSGLSDEWRGLLKYDDTLSYFLSRSFLGGKSWANLAVGYTWRDGAPADQIPLALDGGYGLPWLGAALKAEALYVRSRGNESPRQPDDRFGAGVGFNRASMGRLGASVIVPLGPGPAVERRGRLQQVGLGSIRAQVPGTVLLDRPRFLGDRRPHRALTAVF